MIPGELVVAIFGSGTDEDRAIAVACAEAGARIALATLDRSQKQDYAMNSIANEVWSIGPDQFVSVIDSTESTDVNAFAAEVWDRFGRCDLLVANHNVPTGAPIDELSADEWEDTIALNLTGPFLAAHAFGRNMERQGGGTILLAAHRHPGSDAAYRAAKAGLAGLAQALAEAWERRGVTVELLPAGDGEDIARAAAARLAK
ncbi:MAG: SDR family NAD(P)-dependent oxidoreductase [Hyphomicrobiales bacterium]